jgi:hypothetical protein
LRLSKKQGMALDAMRPTAERKAAITNLHNEHLKLRGDWGKNE